MSKYPSVAPAAAPAPAAEGSASSLFSPPLNIIPSKFNEPLGEQYCLYFSLLSQFSLIAGVATLFALFYAMYKKDSKSYASLISMMGLYLLGYFTNRLMNSMCMGSLKK